MPTLYLSPALRYFEPLSRASALASEHMCFEYDLVEALRPSMLVDVGAGNGSAFFVFCQSMQDHDIDGVCFAVDAWAEDETLPENDEAHSLSFNHHARAHFRGITYLMKMSSEDAVVHFADSSLDLIRLAPSRLGLPLRKAASTWAPKLAPGGVLLCSGTDRVEQELEGLSLGAGSWFSFHHDGGLGVWRKAEDEPARKDAELLRLMASSDRSDHDDLRAYYVHAARYHALRRDVRPHRFNLKLKKKPA